MRTDHAQLDTGRSTWARGGGSAWLLCIPQLECTAITPSYPRMAGMRGGGVSLVPLSARCCRPLRSHGAVAAWARTDAAGARAGGIAAAVKSEAKRS
ncbi:hypothetical protein GCM10023162_40460 [Klenkia terrae]